MADAVQDPAACGAPIGAGGEVLFHLAVSGRTRYVSWLITPRVEILLVVVVILICAWIA